MWKAALLVVAVVVAGHFAVRYLRTNPLAPVIEGGELVVETSEHIVRFGLEGTVGGTYLVANAESLDFGDMPVNAELSAVSFRAFRDYLVAHPDRLKYGSISEPQLENLASSVSVIAANLIAYGDLHALIDDFESRVQSHGDWLCVTIEGDALGLNSASSTLRGGDATSLFATRIGGDKVVFATEVRVEDCQQLLAPS